MTFKMPVHMRVAFSDPSGYATTVGKTPVEFVRVGDRFAPRSLFTTFLGVEGAPTLEMHLEIRNGVPQCREVRIASSEEGREVRPLDLDRVRLNDWVVEIYAHFSFGADEEGPGSMVALTLPATGELPRVVHRLETTRTARRKIDRAFLETVATVYRENIAGHPTEAVADAFDVRHRTAARYVQMARDLKPPLLPPTDPGKKKA